MLLLLLLLLQLLLLLLLLDPSPAHKAIGHKKSLIAIRIFPIAGRGGVH